MIHGIQIKKLRVHCDERGRLMEMVRCDDEAFRAMGKFGQVYMTTAYPGVTKAWHYHKKQWDSMCVVRGMMKIVCYDSRDGSPTRGELNELFVGEHNPAVVTIPPMVYHGFKCISETEALVINTVSEPYDAKQPDEFRLDPHKNDIPYDWSRKDG